MSLYKLGCVALVSVLFSPAIMSLCEFQSTPGQGPRSLIRHTSWRTDLLLELLSQLKYKVNWTQEFTAITQQLINLTTYIFKNKTTAIAVQRHREWEYVVFLILHVMLLSSSSSNFKFT